ncbi:MAG: amidohydrolase family protein [Paludibacteraceae bacterium]|nr:amidohydrolase family protein [Paludibacteraceae bacterium]
MKKLFFAFMSLAAVAFVGCKDNNEPQLKGRNLVVYGKIFTAEKDSEGKDVIADAFVVQDGKFVYVGDSAGAKKYETDGFQVIDYTGKGIIIPGCYEGHAHYLMAKGMDLMGGIDITLNTGVEQFLQMVGTAYEKTKAQGKSSIYGFGWNYQIFLDSGMPTRQQLDSLCPDIALYINDAEGHKGLANTLCLQNAGIMDKDGNVLISKIRGGEIVMDANNKPTGLLKEQAGTFVRTHGINFKEIFPASLAKEAVELSQQRLLAQGFVAYMDGWSNTYGTNAFYEGAKSLEKAGNLHILLGLSYEFESSCESIEAELEKAKQMKQYTGGHINADFVKLFIDGTVETGTGLTMEPYQITRLGNGIANWEQNEVTEITKIANNNGMTMHIHTMGDAAVNRAVNAFVASNHPEARNTVVHCRNVPEADFARMADNNIVAVSGILWHGMEQDIVDALNAALPVNLKDKAYPMKSYFNAGAVMTSHCDFPATSGSPTDPFGIMEIAVTGQVYTSTGKHTEPFWTDELISREQALQALTINGAYQMHIENKRGSIKVGKYADFVLADKDVLSCPVTDIHNAKVVATYFEGEQVYSAK